MFEKTWKIFEYFFFDFFRFSEKFSSKIVFHVAAFSVAVK